MDDWLDYNRFSEFLSVIMGEQVTIQEMQIIKRMLDYAVVAVHLHPSKLDIIVKFSGPGAILDCNFERTAALYRLVSAQTGLPMPQVIAADTTYQRWPMRYLIMGHAPGRELAHMLKCVDGLELDNLRRQLGEAVARLHLIHFPSFGELNHLCQAGGAPDYQTALRQRAGRLIKSNRLLDYFLEIFDRHTGLFSFGNQPRLCHDDLHAYNLLFDHFRGEWRLTAILDFEKAWAGHRESDLARLDLWTGMTGASFWQTYQAILPVDPLYSLRRPIYQLLWCLEYARYTPKHLSDTRKVCRELAVSIPEELFSEFV